ncbi:MAG: hypothetical protein KC620_05845 [Myxococcales bacterium]|nr:hypothetical protein [Myxococcales bacterium]
MWTLFAALCGAGALASAALAAKPLSRPHAHLDVKDQCNQCHVAFGGVPQENCLGCHKEIDQRLKANQGYHAKSARGTPCNNCHREHLGREYEITPLDKRSFDHKTTGWPLVGGHEGVGCRECHTAKRQRTNRDSYLGASTDCKACHGEYHGDAAKANLGQCERCHNAYDWKQLNPNLKFDHQRETRFPLTGKHERVECDKCHLGKRKFGPIEVSGCITCHQDPHPPGVFGARICEECHITADFKTKSIFEHSTTGWPLKGKHARTKCLDCHSWNQWRPRNADCQGCHDDVHRGQFAGVSCGRCHSENGWTGRTLRFNHDAMSRFPLRGKHRQVNCGKCHPSGKYKPIDVECKSCHKDDNPHGTTFGETPCSNCHSPIDWKKTRFDHGITGFPLEGRHVDQPCYRCHPSGTETEDDTQQDCAFCHADVHRDQFEGAGCDRCHRGFERWRIELFDHSLSRFQLQGRHLDVRCVACHKDGHYRPIDTACGNCHQNFHRPQFSKACDECHSVDGWTAHLRFDHDRDSQYPLFGKHRAVDCAKCHVNNRYKPLPMNCDGCHFDVHAGRKGAGCDRCHTTESWTTNSGQNHDFGAFTLGGAHDLLTCERCHGPNRDLVLAGTGPECVNCHKDPHFGSLGPLCLDCHTQEYFLPSTFLHIETGFRLSGAHRFVECRDCHPGRVFGGLPSDCAFCHSDSFAATAGSPICDHPRYVPGGRDSCENCHTTRAWSPARLGVSCGAFSGGGAP